MSMETGALLAFVVVVLVGALLWIRSIQRNVATLKALRAEQEARDEAAHEAAREIAAQPRICKNCKNFDYELGQTEMRRQPVFMQAAMSVPPWRMGRVMKTDENGKHLPLSEQGIDPALMKLEWSDMGACPPRESLVAPIDTCEKFERAQLIAPSSLVRNTSAS